MYSFLFLNFNVIFLHLVLKKKKVCQSFMTCKYLCIQCTFNKFHNLKKLIIFWIISLLHLNVFVSNVYFIFFYLWNLFSIVFLYLVLFLSVTWIYVIFCQIECRVPLCFNTKRDFSYFLTGKISLNLKINISYAKLYKQFCKSTKCLNLCLI